MNSPMRTLIDRLLRESKDAMSVPTSLHAMVPSGTRLLECQLVLKGGYAVAGILTDTAEDTLRMLAPAKKPDGGAIMADHYFDYDDVLTIVIGRAMPSVTPARAGSSIILG